MAAKPLVRGIATPRRSHTLRRRWMAMRGGEDWVALGRLGQMNTTGLISAWSMDGARGELCGRFASVPDIDAIVSERAGQESAGASEPAPSTPELLVRAAEDADWLPLPGERNAA